MPTYEYACRSCEHHFDVRHGADERPALACPMCRSEVRKVFHAAGIIFKGSGWHIKDYAPKSAGADTADAAKAAEPAAKAAESSSGTAEKN
jgi:putative FmdB family regulatory protein